MSSHLGSRVRRHRIPLALAAVAVLGACVAVPAGAQTSNQDRQRQLDQQISEVGASEAEAIRALQLIRDRKALVDTKVAELDAQLRAIEERLAPLEAESNRLAGMIAEAETKLADAQVQWQAAKDRFDDEAAEIYRSARTGAAYEVVAAAPPLDVLKGTAYLDSVNRRQQQIVRRITALREDIETQRRDLATRKTSADTATAEAQQLRDEAAAKRAEIEPARAQAATEAKNEEQQLAYIRSQKAQYESELAALKAVSDSIGGQLRGGGGGGGAAGACTARPVNGTLTSGFGTRSDPFTGAPRTHTGIDLGASSGTPIKACRGGRVVIAGWQGGYGNTVVIDHGGGMATLYAHQSSIAVSEGQQVSAGQVIGSVGSTGNSTGPHLHFEVRINGNPVDPMPYW